MPRSSSASVVVLESGLESQFTGLVTRTRTREEKTRTRTRTRTVWTRDSAQIWQRDRQRVLKSSDILCYNVNKEYFLTRFPFFVC